MKAAARKEMVLTQIQDFGPIRCCGVEMRPVPKLWVMSCLGCGTVCWVGLQERGGDR